MLSFSGCGATQNDNTEGIIVRASISIWSGGAYLFELKGTKELIITSGLGYYDPETDKFYGQADPPLPHERFEEKTVTLSDEDFEEIKAILKELNIENQQIEVDDFWECVICYNGKYTEFSYGISDDPSCQMLMEKLISFSPFKIVNSQGHEAVPFDEIE